MTNYNERLYEILDTLVENAADSDSRLGYVEAYEHAEKAKQAILDLITEETAKARLDELKQLWNSTQPDLVPQGVKPNDMSDELHQRVNQLQAELEEK